MKLVRYGAPGQERPGCMDDEGRVRSLEKFVTDLTGETLSPSSIRQLESLDPNRLPLVDGAIRLGPPVSRVGKIIGIGANYRSFLQISGGSPEWPPLVFLKSPTALCGACDPLVIPKHANKTDWEVELAVVIGTRAVEVSPEDSPNFIAGYAICNDLTERSWLPSPVHLTSSKNADGFAPLGPWLATPRELTDPQALDMWLEVNNVRFQASNTSDMVVPINELIAFISTRMTLLPGDVILTGTPAGVGARQSPPRFLEPGDVVAAGISGLGEQVRHVVSYQDMPSDHTGVSHA